MSAAWKTPPGVGGLGPIRVCVGCHGGLLTHLTSPSTAGASEWRNVSGRALLRASGG